MKYFKKILPILVLLTLILSMIPVSIQADGEAWLTNWDYRKQFTITGSSDGALSNYQLKFTINRSSGSDSGTTVYVGTKCETDYDDIRFTTSDGETLLDYWIESSDSNTATIWVEIDSLAGSPTTENFYLYYGNSGASAVSNGTNTFLLFDDASGTLTDLWTVDSGTWAYVSGELRHSGGDTWQSITAKKTDFPDNIKVEYKHKFSSVAWVNANQVCMRLASASGTTYYEAVCRPADGVPTQRYGWWKMVSGSEAAIGGNNLITTAGVYYKHTHKMSGTSIKTLRDDTDEYATTDSSVTTGGYLRFMEFISSGQYAYIDDIRVMNYTLNEPTITAWGSEETAPISEPTVTTSAATSVTMDKDGVTGGTFNGNLTDLGDNTAADVSFIYGTTSACSDGETTPEELTETGTFDNSVEFPDDWTPGETYYYKAKAVGDTYTTPQYGSAQSIVFTMPTITTEDADYTSPGAATATLNGNISNLQKASDCYVSFEWGYDTGYGNSTTPQTLNATGDFDDTISGFLRNTTVHYRVVIEVGATTEYGSDETFLIAPSDLSEVLWFQPNTIITQDGEDWILPDRDSTQDGVITWGSNAEGITITNSVLISNGSIGVSNKGQHDTIPELNQPTPGIDKVQSDNILISIFSPIADLTDYPLWFLFMLFGLIVVFIVMVKVQQHTQNQMLSSAAGLVIIFGLYKLGIFDWWMFFVPVVFFVAVIVMERKPSL